MLFEDEAKREENVKHFRMSDGSYRAQIFNEPVHYYDETEGKISRHRQYPLRLSGVP